MGLRDILSRSVEESLPRRKRSTMKDRYYQSGYAGAKQGRHAGAGGLGSKNIGGDCGVDHKPQRSSHEFMIKAVDQQFECVSAHFA
jgi:hypothetical protein